MAYCLMMATWPVHCALRSFGFFVVIGPQRVVRFECYCMIGLGASAGGEAGRGSAAALLLARICGADRAATASAGVALRVEEDAAGGGVSTPE